MQGLTIPGILERTLKDEATGMRAVQEATFMELVKVVGAAAAGTPDSTCWTAVVEAHNLLEKEVRAVDVAAGSPDPAYWTAVVEVHSLLEREVGAAVVEHRNLLERVVGADDAADAAAGTIISAPLSSTPHDKLQPDMLRQWDHTSQYPHMSIQLLPETKITCCVTTSSWCNW